jgi:cob(I)alamin adenosyltransferase
MKLYTRGGDAGETGLIGGTRVAKNAPRVATYGEVDELNAVLGMAAAELGPGPHQDALIEVQRVLFALGAELATPPGREAARGTPPLDASYATALEPAIDALTEKVPPLRHFILPGGSRAGAALHLARTVCRRAERAVVGLAAAEPVNAQAVVYLNRLSDYLFALARAVNHEAGTSERVWQGRDAAS